MERTTVRLRPALLERARSEARRRKSTLTSVIEVALETMLNNPEAREPDYVFLPVSDRTGGTLPGVDINHSSALLDIMAGL